MNGWEDVCSTDPLQTLYRPSTDPLQTALQGHISTPMIFIRKLRSEGKVIINSTCLFVCVRVCYFPACPAERRSRPLPRAFVGDWQLKRGGGRTDNTEQWAMWWTGSAMSPQITWRVVSVTCQTWRDDSYFQRVSSVRVQSVFCGTDAPLVTLF